MVYRFYKFREFLFRQDWNLLFQEIATVLISIGIGLYFYETKNLPSIFQPLEGLGGPTQGILQDLFGETSRPYLQAGAILVCACLFIKLAIYFAFLDANSLKLGKVHGLKKRRGIDIQGILQEILTAILGITVGMFTTPVVSNVILVEKADYPNPALGISLTLACLFLKILLFSQALDFNQGFFSGKKIWQPKKIKPFLGQYDWNEFFQEASSTCIGIGLGFYMYESRIIFLPEQWFPGIFGEGRKITEGIWNKVTQTVPSFNLVPDIWSNEAAKPYIVLGMYIIGFCVVLKLLMYFSLFNANQLRNFLLGKKEKARSALRIDYNGIVNEFITLGLTTLFGILSTPIMEGALLNEQSGNSRVQVACLFLFFLLVWVKISIAVGALEFTGHSRKL